MDYILPLVLLAVLGYMVVPRVIRWWRFDFSFLPSKGDDISFLNVRHAQKTRRIRESLDEATGELTLK
jgi:hypothetical protein